MGDKADIGLTGLAVMGQNLALNIADHGFSVAVHNRTTERTHEFLAGEGAHPMIVGVESLEALVTAVSRPRRIILMVKAGAAVDAVVERLHGLLDPGDMIVDGGNSHHDDTVRRTAAAEAAGLLFVGAGISGGEEGARHGPSIMPGGSAEAWPHLSGLLQAIAADADDGVPCCDWIGPDGAGHFVKIVHNGIEYGDMQVLAESYDVMRRGLGMDHTTIADVYSRWNEGSLQSYLVEISADIMRRRKPDGTPLIESILDAAGQKGTGRWTVESALAFDAPATLAATATFARTTSSLVESRRAASELLPGPDPVITDDRDGVVADLEAAVYASKIVSYAQGFMLMNLASVERGWGIDLGAVAAMWRAGCIIRARFLDDIRRAFAARDDEGFLHAPFFVEALRRAEPGWRRTVSRAFVAGLPVPAYASALAFYDAYRSERLPAALIQAQRDYFGAHTYERTDRPRGEFHHTDWLEDGEAT